MLKLIATGTGRCGTGYVATILNQAGVVAGHEGVFSYNGPRQDTKYEADVSWMALPFLADYDCLKIGIWRDRDQCIASLNKVRIMDSGNPYSQFVLDRGYETVEQFYNDWNLQVWRNTDAYFNITEMNHDVFVRILNAAELEYDDQALRNALEHTPKNINTR